MSDKMREEFEAWFRQNYAAHVGGFGLAESDLMGAWHAAYAAGRKAGMEEAAGMCDAINRDRERAMAVSSIDPIKATVR